MQMMTFKVPFEAEGVQWEPPAPHVGSQYQWVAKLTEEQFAALETTIATMRASADAAKLAGA